ncbi:hypothetical protein HOY82DRAFT_617739 [Tuber indicum]|nr:hypothetical protein HOY82DRAFT_617739 [Tuber indicum]
MGRAAGVQPRSEDGNRDMAELLHARMNTALQYGRRYRRFVCRSNVGCGQSFIVTDFIKLRDHSRLSGSGDSYRAILASRQSAPVPIWSSVNTPYPDSNSAFRSAMNLSELISDGDPVNCQEYSDYSVQHILTRLQGLRETLSQEKAARIHLESEVARLLAVVDIHGKDKLNISKQPELKEVASISPVIRATQGSKSEINLGNEQNSKSEVKEACEMSTYACVAGRSQYSIQKSAMGSSESGSDQDERESESKYSQMEAESPLERAEVQPRSASVAIYVSGVPFLPIREVKRLLAQKPNHVKHMQNSISKQVEFRVRNSFDPLSISSFEWEENVTPERKETILMGDFVRRVSSSIAAMQSDATRRYLIEWGRNRGFGPELETALRKQHRITLPWDRWKEMEQPVVTKSLPQGTGNGVRNGAKLFLSRKRGYSPTDTIASVGQEPPRKMLVLKPTRGTSPSH